MNIVIIFLFMLQCAFAQKNIHSKRLTSEEQSMLKSYFQHNFKVDSGSSLLVIYYIQPQEYCHNNRYDVNPATSIAWFEKYYRDNNIIFPESTQKLFSFYDEQAGAKLKGTSFVHDKNHVLHKLIKSLNKDKTCNCMLMISPEGKLIIKYGEATAADFKHIIKETTKEP